MEQLLLKNTHPRDTFADILSACAPKKICLFETALIDSAWYYYGLAPILKFSFFVVVGTV